MLLGTSVSHNTLWCVRRRLVQDPQSSLIPRSKSENAAALTASFTGRACSSGSGALILIGWTERAGGWSPDEPRRKIYRCTPKSPRIGGVLYDKYHDYKAAFYTAAS